MNEQIFNQTNRTNQTKETEISRKFKLGLIAICFTIFLMMVIDLAVNPKKEVVEKTVVEKTTGMPTTLCEEIFIQEVNNIKIGIQDIDGAMKLLYKADCDYKYQEIIDALGFDDGLLCPVALWEQYGWDCLNHINEWYPGKLTSSGDSQEMPELVQKTSHERFKELCQKYGLNASAIWEVENKYNLREGIILAIIIAETSGGKNGYGVEGCWNYGNVGNNDRGDRYCFTSESEGLHKIGKTLSNQFLGKTQTLGCLSKAGSCTWWEDRGYVYASSDGNWERTIVNVLNAIYQEELGDIDPTRFNVRRIFTQYQ